MTILAEATTTPDEPLPGTHTSEPLQEAAPYWPAELASTATAAAGVWVYIDRKTTRLNGSLTREACLHDSTVLMRFDADELGEWDDIPNRAIVCLGCEAVRWL